MGERLSNSYDSRINGHQAVSDGRRVFPPFARRLFIFLLFDVHLFFLASMIVKGAKRKRQRATWDVCAVQLAA